MDNPFKHALQEVVTFLDTQQLRYALIGGIANQAWGQARFTYDIDLKVLVPDLEYERMRRTLTAAFPEQGRPDLPMNPLIVSVNVNGVLVDFLLTTPGYEEQLVRHAIRYTIEDLSLWICTPEDLIIQKIIAGRPKDWQDIEGIIIEQYDDLNQEYLGDWLRQFAEILEKPELLTRYQQIWQHVTTSKARG
jgi:hypothetical protein